MSYLETAIPARDLQVGDVLISGGTVTSVDTTTVWGQVTIEVDYAHQFAFNHGDRVLVTRNAPTTSTFTLELSTDGAAFETEIEGAANFEVVRILEVVAERLREGHPGPFPLLDSNGNVVGRASFDTEIIDTEELSHE